MRQLARSLTLLVMLGACTPDMRSDAERSADAARADSSAAGYDVGPAAPDRHLASASSGSGAPRVDSAAHRLPAPGSRTAGDGGAAASPAADTNAATSRAAGPATSGAATGPGAQQGPPIGPTRSSPDSAASVLPPLSAAAEATFLAFDTTRRTATFQLAAGDEVPEQVSFNGSRRGRRTLTVPLGWRLTIAFANRDPDLPHSATIVEVTAAVPEQLPAAAFDNGQTVRLTDGLLEGDSDEISFVADRAGRYLIACGVLGHAQRGQWIAFEISPTATVPRYR